MTLNDTYTDPFAAESNIERRAEGQPDFVLEPASEQLLPMEITAGMLAEMLPSNWSKVLFVVDNEGASPKSATVVYIHHNEATLLLIEDENASAILTKHLKVELNAKPRHYPLKPIGPREVTDQDYIHRPILKTHQVIPSIGVIGDK